MPSKTAMKFISYIFLFSIFNTVYAAGGSSKSATSKYFSISPPVVVNVTDKGRVRHLQVSVQLRLEDPNDANAIQEHKPALQHELVMLLSGREAAEVRSTQGKEALRSEATSIIQKFLTENIGKPTITAVYFTAFVIQ